MTTISNVRIFDGTSFTQDTSVTFDQGVILETGKDRCGIDMDGCILAPGFVDIHMHGFLGYDAMHPGHSKSMAALEPQFGTTAFCPTSMTDKNEPIRVYLQNIRSAKQSTSGARILGAYLEGPYLAAPTRGAHDEALLRDPLPEDYAELVRGYESEVVRITLAPERPGGFELVEQLSRQGVMVSIGHSAATYEQACRAFDLGIRSTTHTCNGMLPLHHRTPGVLGAVLTDDRVKAELIADLHHVHPAVIDLIYRVKGPEGCYFCTDSLEATGLSDGTYYNGTDPTPIIVTDGIALKNGGLAGSTLTMDRGLRNLVQTVGIPLEHALRMGTRNPADAIGRRDLGRIEPGCAADFVLLDPRLQVRATYIRGLCEYQR